jgi:oligosaccharyltransferase complex subunit epsilon
MAPKKHKPVHVDPVQASTLPSRPVAFLAQTPSFNFDRLSTATNELWKSYRSNTPNSLLIIDAFLVFLMYVGTVQFVYACLTGGYPFNSFLAGFSAAVGQFVLTGDFPYRTNGSEFEESGGQGQSIGIP